MDKEQIRLYAIEEYERWKKNTLDDPSMQKELAELAGSEEEVIDAFCAHLSFGTSGIRGVLGPGTNRMNEYVVRRTTQGLANYLNRTYAAPSVIIACDTRRKSRIFAEETAGVLRGNGIKVYLFDRLATVSLLSYGTRMLGCTMGIMITASHNPKIFNGYKVYSSEGYQIVGSVCNEILKEIDSVDFFDDIRTSDQGIISVDQEVEDSFIKEIVSMAPVKASETEALNKERLRVVYTPLNGTGNFYVRKVLTEIGFPHLVVVESQELPDENFSTCPTPNPEKITAFNEGFKVLDKVDGDIIIATDPDCDRVGVCIYHDGMKVLLTGNQLGVLMLDYLCQVKPPSDGQLLIKSIVTTPLAAKIAERHGLKVCNTLTGFKYIGEIIAKLDAEGKKDRYYFGFEESHGYLMNPFIRDKDGVSSAMLTVCLAAYHKAQGRDLLQRLHEIYREYGPSYDKTRSFSFEGPYGKMAMDKVMDFFRQDVRESLGGFAVTEKIDYMEETGLPKADVVSFTLENSTQVVIRPSGTEPKIKLYLFESESGSGIEQALKSIVESFKNA